MVRPSPTRGRCVGSGRASAAGDPGCVATAGSLRGWPADASALAGAAAAAAAV